MGRVYISLNVLIFALVLYLWLIHDPYILTFQVLYTLEYLNIKVLLGLDGVSICFIYLTSYLILLCNVSLYNNKSAGKGEYSKVLLSILIILIYMFLVLDIFYFYVCFELLILPFFIYMGINGYANRRRHAAMLFFFYSFVGSIFLIIGIFSLYLTVGSTSLLDLYCVYMPFHYESVIWILLFISIAIKVPMYPFHLWLPEAHVQASTEGSVLLAGVILKLSIYGLIRFVYPIFNYSTYYYAPVVLLLASVSILYSVFTTLRQIDIKRVIAYSSITHMNMSMLGMFLFNYTSVMGALYMSISHGLVSSALFFMVGMLYKRYHTKLIFYYRDLFTRLPIITVLFLLFILGNVGFPLTCGFIGELLLIIGIYSSKNIVVIICSCIGMFITTVYSFILYEKLAYTQGNKDSNLMLIDIELYEFVIASSLLIHVVLTGICPFLILMLLQDFIFMF